jgi:putative FmdB family regulatory protein
MPTYEYECTKCQHAFEAFQSMRDEPLKKCPKCRGKVKRLLGSGAGIIFKGSGFYQTDYRSSSYHSGAKTAASPSVSSSSASSSSATPPAPATEKKSADAKGASKKK